MNRRTLIGRSLRHYWKSHLAIFLGASLGSAVLIGALIVGDSVRGSLQVLGLQRLAGFNLALNGGDRFFRSTLFDSLEPQHSLAGHLPAGLAVDPTQVEMSGAAVPLLHLPGTASTQDQSARANRVHIYGVPMGRLFQSFNGASTLGTPDAQGLWIDQIEWEKRVNQPLGTVILNEALSRQLSAKVGDELVFRLHRPSALSRDAVITPRDDQSVALRLKVHSIVEAQEGGNFSLSPSQTPPLNAFVRLEELDQSVGVSGLANMAMLPSLVFRSEPKVVSQWTTRLKQLSHRYLGYPTTLDPVGKPAVPDRQQVELFDRALGHLWDLPDAELQLRPTPNAASPFELISRRIFLEDAAAKAARTPMITNRWRNDIPAQASGIVTQSVGVLTYLVNQISAGDRSTPYSMVTAAEAPWVPDDLKEDEIIVNEWLAADLQVGPGSLVDLTYYLLDTGSQLQERTNRFRVHSVVPIQGIYDDRTLMPEFPGLSKAESTRDWDAGFKLVNTIRDKDEAYWKQFRGTPKAFISLSTGQKLWANRFGSLTSIRYLNPQSLPTAQLEAIVQSTVLSNLDPAAVGLRSIPVREQALNAANDSQDFAGLFIGFSFFLIVSALILVALLFQFGVEQRQVEIGTLLAIGFPPRRVRRLLLAEGIVIAVLAATLGAIGGAGYAKAMLWGLGHLWQDAVGTSSLQFHTSPATLVIGIVSGIFVSAGTIAWVLRAQGRRPARELLGGGVEESGTVGSPKKHRVAKGVTFLGFAGSLGIVGMALVQGARTNPQVFFGAGALALIGGLGAVSLWLSRVAEIPSTIGFTRLELLVKGLGRRRSRSLATSALLACGTFLVMAIGANRLDATRDANLRSSGTGGFALIGESALPVTRDLNSVSGREALGLEESSFSSVSIVPFRLKPGDDASCLNLNRAQNPRLLGVKPSLLDDRHAFSFDGVAKGLDGSRGWKLLEPDPSQPDVVPAIGDAASIQWALGKSLGDTIPFVDERGHTFQLKLVAGLANSILQGSLVVDEKELTRRYPSGSGHQFFLMDAPAGQVVNLSKEITRGLRDFGLEVTPTVIRLAQFNGVQNTYLNTFQVLGGLGLLLGSVGLGVVVLRNALERRQELALLQAIGYQVNRISRGMIQEHLILLGLGLGVGVGAALLAVVPSWLSPSGTVPIALLAGVLGGVFVLGVASTWLATRAALGGKLLDNLRSE